MLIITSIIIIVIMIAIIVFFFLVVLYVMTDAIDDLEICNGAVSMCAILVELHNDATTTT